MTFKMNQSITGKILTLKLCSGEELIVKVINVESDSIEVSDPVSIAPGPQGMGLIPSLFTGDPATSVFINTNNIAIYTETEDAVKMKYIEATTGITVPSKKIIMG